MRVSFRKTHRRRCRKLRFYRSGANHSRHGCICLKREQDALMEGGMHRVGLCLHTSWSPHRRDVSLALRAIFWGRQRTTWDYDSIPSESLEGTSDAQLLKAWGTDIIDIFKCWAAVTLTIMPSTFLKKSD